MNTNTPKPLTSTSVETLTRAVLAAARDGDRRARTVTVSGRTGIVTPHEDAEGNLDADDLAAQVWAFAHDKPSDDGSYEGGMFSHRGVGYYRAAPE